MPPSDEENADKGVHGARLGDGPTWQASCSIWRPRSALRRDEDQRGEQANDRDRPRKSLPPSGERSVRHGCDFDRGACFGSQVEGREQPVHDRHAREISSERGVRRAAFERPSAIGNLEAVCAGRVSWARRNGNPSENRLTDSDRQPLGVTGHRETANPLRRASGCQHRDRARRARKCVRAPAREAHRKPLRDAGREKEWRVPETVRYALGQGLRRPRVVRTASLAGPKAPMNAAASPTTARASATRCRRVMAVGRG